MGGRIETRGLLEKAEKAMEALGGLLHQVNKNWKKLDNRVLGHILRSPAITLGVSEHRFTEDWGIFLVNQSWITASRAIRWTSVRFDYPTKTVY